MSGKTFRPKYPRSKAHKSQTESEQNRFSENKTSWLFFPVSSFCDLFMDVPPYLGANNIRKYLCEFFNAIRTRKKIAESRAKFHKFCSKIALVCTKFLKNSPGMVFFPKFCVRISTEFATKRDTFQVKRMSIHPGKKIKQFHTRTNLPFSPDSDE